MQQSMKYFMEKTINDSQTKNIKSEKNYWKKDSRNADKKIKYCPKCESCWEMWTEQRGPSRERNTMINKYNDFPSYGKEEAICQTCKN